MKKIFFILFILSTYPVYASLNANEWHPNQKHRCGMTKFKCPKLNNQCLRKPVAQKCEVIKIIKNQVRYVDYCKERGLTCIGSYSTCEVPNSNGLMESSSYTQNPYLACAP